VKIQVLVAIITVASYSDPLSSASLQSKKYFAVGPSAYQEIRARQALGRILVTPDGKLVLFEWGRPFLNWKPSTAKVAPGASNRLQTFLFKIDVSAESPEPTYLIQPRATATYWLGNISPDASKVVVFEMDRVSNDTKVGVLDLVSGAKKWFAEPANAARVEESNRWVSTNEFIYEVGRGSGRMLVANAESGEVAPCTKCARALSTAESRPTDVGSRAAVNQSRAAELPIGAVFAGGSSNGDLSVYQVDDEEKLSLILVQPTWMPYTVFESSRR
jgi:hypothetical protein